MNHPRFHILKSSGLSFIAFGSLVVLGCAAPQDEPSGSPSATEKTQISDQRNGDHRPRRDIMTELSQLGCTPQRENATVVRVSIPDSTDLDAVLAVLVQFPNLKTVHIFSGPDVAIRGPDDFSMHEALEDGDLSGLKMYEWEHESAEEFLQQIRGALPKVEITTDVGAL